jgi:hypothetical protein
MQLLNPTRLSASVDERIKLALAAGCGRCGESETAQLTRRLGAGGVVINLQCLKCGHSLAGALPRAGCIHWQDYPAWDATLEDAWFFDQQQRRAAGWRDLDQEREREKQRRREDYARWLATSPEWSRLRERVLVRDRYICQACLNERATQVHHLTYDHGPLPPAFFLVSLCGKCHARWHRGWDRDGD